MTAAGFASAGPLAGIRVVEVGGMGPVPFCGMVLADLGAEVIRIHRPQEIGSTPNPVLTRGKLSVAIDLKSPDGLAVVRRLLDSADVALEGFRPGVLERLGLAPDQLRGSNLRLVVGRMTGFGQDGPLAQQGGHDINYLALSGALGALGVPGQPPLPPMNLVADFGGGAMILTVGVLSALLHARATGAGQVIDASMVDGAALLMAMAYGNYGLGRWEPTQGSDPFSGGRPSYATYRCSDGRYVALGASEPKFFRTLVERLGLSETIDVDRQTDRATWETQRAAFTATFATRPQDEWIGLFADVDACITPVLAPDEAPGHPHNLARGTFVTGEDGVVQPAPAPRFSGTPAPAPRRPATPGEHSEQVLATLGLSSTEIEALRASGTIG